MQRKIFSPEPPGGSALAWCPLRGSRVHTAGLVVLDQHPNEPACGRVVAPELDALRRDGGEEEEEGLGELVPRLRGDRSASVKSMRVVTEWPGGRMRAEWTATCTAGCGRRS